MIQLFDKKTGAPLGTLNDEQFQFLADRLEEESSHDDATILNRATVDILEEQGADPALVALLRTALGNATRRRSAGRAPEEREGAPRMTAGHRPPRQKQRRTHPGSDRAPWSARWSSGSRWPRLPSPSTFGARPSCARSGRRPPTSFRAGPWPPRHHGGQAPHVQIALARRETLRRRQRSARRGRGRFRHLTRTARTAAARCRRPGAPSRSCAATATAPAAPPDQRRDRTDKACGDPLRRIRPHVQQRRHLHLGAPGGRHAGGQPSRPSPPPRRRDGWAGKRLSPPARSASATAEIVRPQRQDRALSVQEEQAAGRPAGGQVPPLYGKSEGLVQGLEVTSAGSTTRNARARVR